MHAPLPKLLSYLSATLSFPFSPCITPMKYVCVQDELYRIYLRGMRGCSCELPLTQIEQPVVPQAHLTMVRLLHNMQRSDSKPTRPSNYWAESRIGCFLTGTKSAELYAGILVQFLASPNGCVLTTAQILSFIESTVCQPFLLLTHLGGRLLGATERMGTPEFETVFDSAFAIGPGGLHGLVPHVLHTYLALPVALRSGASPVGVSTVYDKLTEFSYSMLQCLQHLRFKHHRSEWDPRGGCRELATILNNKDSELPVATKEDFEHLRLKLLMACLEKDSPNVSEISFLLMGALGDASNPRQMTADRVLKGGEFGMARFYNLVIARVLDNIDTAHPDYASLLGTVQSASAGIARKIRDYFKGGGSNAKASGPSSSGPSTRSRSKRITGNLSDHSDDMTNTDSLGSGWENDCSAEEPDTFAHWAKCRRRYAKSPPVQPKCPESPPVVISSERDSAWTQTYNKWKKRVFSEEPHAAQQLTYARLFLSRTQLVLPAAQHNLIAIAPGRRRPRNPPRRVSRYKRAALSCVQTGNLSPILKFAGRHSFWDQFWAEPWSTLGQIKTVGVFNEMLLDLTWQVFVFHLSGLLSSFSGGPSCVSPVILNFWHF
ncbi:hypothetical protein B0H14DRAFT_3636039 [Mycena olivaceomarginata]|nr:hypothetical protein B0H14DRAFT_3636039 [Mycena olivaceomarginata]